jgi:hypothetical protein
MLAATTSESMDRNGRILTTNNSSSVGLNVFAKLAALITDIHDCWSLVNVSSQLATCKFCAHDKTSPDLILGSLVL